MTASWSLLDMYLLTAISSQYSITPLSRNFLITELIEAIKGDPLRSMNTQWAVT
jgi:hypothetical protein